MNESNEPIESSAERPRAPAVAFREACGVWARIAALSFGGPAGQIAVMQRILVDEKRWVSEERFLHALNYCMLLPGPEAQQLATYAGWLLHRARGGLVAGLLFVLPGFVSILALSVLYAELGNTAVVAAMFFGLKPAVLAIVVEALIRIGRRALRSTAKVLVAGVLGSVVTTWVTFAPCFLWIFLGAPYIEWLRGRRALSNALSAITAAVVGVILNLAVWFALHTLFGQVDEVRTGPLRLLVPDWGTVDSGALLIAVAAFVAMFVLRWGMLRTLAGGVLAGLAWRMVVSLL